MKPHLFFVGLISLLSQGSLSAATAQEPERKPSAGDLGRGQQVVIQSCTECHNLRRVFRANYDRDGWNEAITRMIGQGLEISDADRWAAVQYLANQDPPSTLNEQVGKLHFAMVHFPIALILAVGFLDSISLARSRKLADSVGILLWMTALAAMVTVLTGLRRADPWATVSPLLELHERAGFATFALILAAAVLRQIHQRRGTRGRLIGYALVLVVASAVTLITGHMGGTVVHG